MKRNSTIIWPKGNGKNGTKARAISPALVRFFSLIVSIVFLIGTLFVANKTLGIEINLDNIPVGEINIQLVIVSLIFLFIGMQLGAAIGSLIEVRSEKLNHVFSTLWHYNSQGYILWSLILICFLSKSLGKEGIVSWAKSSKQSLLLFYFIIVVLVGCTLIGSFLLLTGQLKKDEKPKLMQCIISAIPIAIVMGYVQLRLFHLDSFAWLVMGIIFPLMLIPAAAFTMERDKQLRAKIMKRFEIMNSS